MLYVIGAVFIILPLVVFLYERHIISNGIEVEAVVVRTEEVRGRRGQRFYHAVLSYEVDGKKYETKSQSGFSIKTQAVGDHVRLYCHKENPKKFVVKGHSRVLTYILLVLLAIIGVLFIVIRFF